MKKFVVVCRWSVCRRAEVVMWSIHPSAGLPQRICRRPKLSKYFRRTQCQSRAAHNRRKLLGGLLSLGWTFSCTHQSQAEETAIEEGSSTQQPEFVDPLEKPSLPTFLSIFGDEWLSLFSVVTSLSLGAIATQFKTKADATEDALKKAEASTGSLKSKLRAIEIEYSQTVSTLKDARKTVQMQSKQIQAERNESIRLDGELNKLQGDYIGKEKEAEQLREKVTKDAAETSANLKNAKGKIASLKENLEGEKKVSEDRNRELTEVQRVLSMREDELTHAQSHIADLEEQISSAESSLVEERERLATLEKARVAAVADIKKLLSEQRNLSFELKAEKSAVSEINLSLKAQQVEIDELKGELLDSVNQARAAHARLTTAEHEVGQLKRSQLASFAKDKAQTSEIEGLKDRVAEERTAVYVLEQKVSDLASRLDSKEATVQGLEADAALKIEEIKELESAKELMQQDRSDLMGRLSNLLESEKDRKDARLKLEEECKRLGESLNKSEKTAMKFEAGLLSEQKDATSLRRNLMKNQKEIAAANQKLYFLQERIREMEDETERLAGVEEQLGAVTKEAAKVQEKLVIANKKTQELENSQSLLKEARENMKALREEMSAIQGVSRGEVRKAKMQLSSSQAEVKELKKSLELLKRDVSDGGISKASAKRKPRKSLPTMKAPIDYNPNAKMIPGNPDVAGSRTAPSDIKTIAEVRAQAVQIVEEIEDSAGDAIENAKKAARESEKAALKGLMAATSAQGQVDRLQGSLASATEELNKKNDQITKLQSKVSQLSDSQEEEKPADVKDDVG